VTGMIKVRLKAPVERRKSLGRPVRRDEGGAARRGSYSLKPARRTSRLPWKRRARRSEQADDHLVMRQGARMITPETEGRSRCNQIGPN